MNPKESQTKSQYDIFMGRVVYHNDHELFVTHGIEGATATSSSLDHILGEICFYVAQGKKLQFTQVPESLKSQANHDSRTSSKSYELFTEEQINTLKDMYETRKDMKEFENPFDNQP